ncbi:MAG: bifunctional precorrin-2 dehydrogenase/sirohydrochlorin ferrochelatase [Thermodesulfovibrio sp.]|nr:bifunctional precorrin-2 dehydrogenase/sirohydrochlorin ferrochelatase [Thermodesulfovibrio sp.]
MVKFFPILIDIRDKHCVVVGGGSVAERKVKTLLKYGAKVTVISPNITQRLRKIFLEKKIGYINRKYKKGDLKGAYLVVAATSDRKVNLQVAKDAKFLVNLVEKTEKIKNSNIVYIVPAVVEKTSLTVAISTEFPALSRSLKNELSKFFGKEFALFTRYLRKLRREIQKKVPNTKKRQSIFRKIASEEIVSILRQYGFKEAKKEVEKILNEI